MKLNPINLSFKLVMTLSLVLTLAHLDERHEMCEWLMKFLRKRGKIRD